jgi:hypothetical protein
MTTLAAYRLSDTRRARVILAPSGAGKSFLCRCFDAGIDFDNCYESSLREVVERTGGCRDRKNYAVATAAYHLLREEVMNGNKPVFTSLIEPVHRMIQGWELSNQQLLIWLPSRANVDRQLYLDYAKATRACVSFTFDLSDVFTLVTEA